MGRPGALAGASRCRGRARRAAPAGAARAREPALPRPGDHRPGGGRGPPALSGRPGLVRARARGRWPAGPPRGAAVDPGPGARHGTGLASRPGPPGGGTALAGDLQRPGVRLAHAGDPLAVEPGGSARPPRPLRPAVPGPAALGGTGPAGEPAGPGAAAAGLHPPGGRGRRGDPRPLCRLPACGLRCRGVPAGGGPVHPGACPPAQPPGPVVPGGDHRPGGRLAGGRPGPGRPVGGGPGRRPGVGTGGRRGRRRLV